MNKLFGLTAALLLSTPVFQQSADTHLRPTKADSVAFGPDLPHHLRPRTNASLAMGVDIGAKINSAVSSCAGAKCSIYVPAGTYTITTPIVLASNVDLSCAGRDQTILSYTAAVPSTGNSLTTQQITTMLTIPIGAIDVKFHDCGLRGTIEIPGAASSYNNTQALSVLGKNSLIRNISTAHFWAYTNSINMAGSYNTIENSRLEYGTFVVGGGGDHNTYRHNYISNHYSTAKVYETQPLHYWDGVNLEGASYTTVELNTVEDNGQSGIYQGGNGKVAHNNKIVSNTVRENWNRGIDAGVTGDLSPRNGILSTIINFNIVVDNLADNIWVICNIGGSIRGNRSEYTTSYPLFFGAAAKTDRSGIVIGDICGDAATDITTGMSASDNTAVDYLSSSFGLNINLKAHSAGNSFFNNYSNAKTFVSSTIDYSKNTFRARTAPLPDASKPTLLEIYHP